MAYLINRYNGQQLLVLEDGRIDTSTSLSLVGRNYTGYGELQNENFVFLLENFANSSPPPRPVSGQIWYSTQSKNLSVYDGTSWKNLGTAAVSESAPTEDRGAIWLDSSTNQLYVFNETWKLVGPEAVEGFGVTNLKGFKILDNTGINHAVLQILVDDEIIAIISKNEFTIGPQNLIENFSLIRKGITFSSKFVNDELDFQLTGDLRGNATSATRLQNPRRINGTIFDGQADIIINSNTFFPLRKGDYLLGSDFNGSQEVTLSVNATPNGSIGTIVARDSSGNFSAGTITANLIGNVTGNVTVNSGTSTFDIVSANQVIGNVFTGNSLTTDKLRIARKINQVSFDGTSDITITAAANTLTGNQINQSVLYSSLESVGVLNKLETSNTGIYVGNNNVLRLFVDGSEDATIRSQINGKPLNFELNDSNVLGNTARIKFISSATSLALGGPLEPAIIPDTAEQYNLGISTSKWKNIYTNFLIGTATTAQYADLAEKYTADAEYEVGTVVIFGGSKEITIADQPGTTKIAGIISNKPAYLMNSELKSESVAIVALQGRVPCKVIGPIRKGDMLISAGNGKAMACKNPEIGAVIGKSLADFDEKEGIVEVVVGRL